MTPEHNPPKDPSLAETKVLPRTILLEVGRTYETESGDRAVVIEYDGADGSLSTKVRWLSGKFAGKELWGYRTGAFYSASETGFNLVRECIAPAPQAPKCENCDGTGQVDSGGQDGAGNWINRDCPECRPLDPSPVLGDVTALDFEAMIANAVVIPKDGEGPDWACPGCGNTDKNRFKTVQLCGDSPNGPAEYELECEDCGGNEAQESPREALHLMADVVESQAETITDLQAQVQALMEAVAQAREALDRARMRFASVKSHLGKEVSDDGPRDFAWTEACYGWDECERALASIIQPDGGKA